MAEQQPSGQVPAVQERFQQIRKLCVDARATRSGGPLIADPADPRLIALSRAVEKLAEIVQEDLAARRPTS
jgi:hypothetical protein